MFLFSHSDLLTYNGSFAGCKEEQKPTIRVSNHKISTSLIFTKVFAIPVSKFFSIPIHYSSEHATLALSECTLLTQRYLSCLPLLNVDFLLFIKSVSNYGMDIINLR